MLCGTEVRANPQQGGFIKNLGRRIKPGLGGFAGERNKRGRVWGDLGWVARFYGVNPPLQGMLGL
jgi:hypothetical protein